MCIPHSPHFASFAPQPLTTVILNHWEDKVPENSEAYEQLSSCLLLLPTTPPLSLTNDLIFISSPQNILYQLSGQSGNFHWKLQGQPHPQAGLQGLRGNFQKVYLVCEGMTG